MNETMTDPILCYVDGPWAYFTTATLAQQWGDDWNDAPYEHNAGRPYEWREYMRERGIEPYEVSQVAWEAPMQTPRDGHLNSPYSVEQINAGAAPWLATDEWHDGDPIAIPAGTPLSLFTTLVQQSGGDVYLPAPKTNAPTLGGPEA